MTADVARLLLLQNYLTCVWSVYDIIAGIVASVYVPQSIPKIEEAKLCWDLLSKKAIYLHATWLKGNFGWPIVVSYRLRNLFVHDAGLWKLRSMFTGSLITYGFQISPSTLAEIADEQRGKSEKGDFKFDESDTIRDGWPWTSKVEPCILELLNACHEEADAAIGIMVCLCIKSLRDNLAILADHRGP